MDKPSAGPGRSGDRHCTADQSCYVPLERHFVIYTLYLNFILAPSFCLILSRIAAMDVDAAYCYRLRRSSSFVNRAKTAEPIEMLFEG